jgi:serine/threonine-protein kinase
MRLPGGLDAVDRTGEIVAGRYQLVSLLGKGGQGRVYRGRDLLGGRDVALKVLDDAALLDPEARERMQREATALSLLEGTAAVRIFEQLVGSDGAFYLAMELLRGTDLEVHLTALERQGRRMPVARLIELLDPIVRTLELAHSQSMIHRDIKPANIFVVDEYQGSGVRLLDFGFAKFRNMRALTQTGFVAGSPAYIAPEAWHGTEGVDHRVDIYALAAVVFRALGGRAPFYSEDVLELVKLATTAERPSLHALRPDLPPSIDDWTLQALAIDPKRRFSNIVAMWNALKAEIQLG